MKVLSFLFFFLGFLSPLAPAIAQNNAKADKILKDSKAQFNALSDFSASFTYSLKNPNLQKAIIKKGKLKIKKAKYKILFTDEEFYCDGKKVWVFLKPENEVNISTFDPDESISVDRVYSIYEKSGKTRLDSEEGNSYKITIFVADDNSDIWKAEVWIGKNNKMLVKGVLHSKNGSQYQYDLQDINTNQGISDAEFVFDKTKHPGVYENHLDD